MVSDGIVDAMNWTIRDASHSTVSDGVKEIHEQMPCSTVMVLMFVSMLCLRHRWKLSDAWVIVGGYMAADVYMAVLHMWLDHPRTRECAVDFLKDLALDFQKHHKNPFGVVVSNHVSSIDMLNIMTLGTPILWILFAKLLRGRSMPPQLSLFALATSLAGILAAYNHVCCHARTHRVKIPAIIEMAQDFGVLPHNDFHRTHHTPPHDRNFAFLVGGAPVYDFLYTNLQQLFERYYDVMTVLYVLVQPFVVTSIIAVCVLLKAPAKEKDA
jgi:hypothetical protein